MIGGMRYPGGKGKCYQRIINLMPPHEIYIETHLGGGAVIRRKRPANVNIGVEADPAVADSWKRMGQPGCDIIQGDAVAFLREFPFSGRELVYSDPPYLPAARRKKRVYRYDYAESDHVALLDVLKSLPCPVLVSGYRSGLYDETLAGWRRVDFAAMSHGGVRTESVWCNFDPPTELHDYSYLGWNFREREKISRRLGRLRQKIFALSETERSALLAYLNEGGSPCKKNCGQHMRRTIRRAETTTWAPSLMSRFRRVAICARASTVPRAMRRISCMSA